MKRFLNLLGTGAMALALVLAVSSCEKKEPSYGLTTVSVVTVSGQSYNFTIDQTALTADNTADPVPIYTQDAELKSCTVNVAATLDATVSYKGAPVTSGKIEGVDMTSPLSVTVSIEEWTKTYTVTMVKGEVSADLQKGVRMSADLRNTGLPADITDYDVVYNDGKFYMNLCTYTASATEGENGTAAYLGYSSIDGINWAPVTSNLSNVGAVGARSVVLNDKIYVIGGTKTWGNDADGYKPESELSWGLVYYNVKYLRVFETTDYTTVADDTSSITYSTSDGSELTIGKKLKRSNAPVNYNQLTVLDGKIFWKSGFNNVYGQMQNITNGFIASADGKAWTEYIPTESASTARKIPAFFSFQGKLWQLGGFKSFPADINNLGNATYSSDNGLTWTDVETTGLPALVGSTVAVNKSGKTAYLFGGFYNEGEVATVNPKVYKSTDGIAWTEVETSTGYTGSFSPAVVVDDNNIAWVYDRFATKLGTYSYSTSADEVKANIIADVWAFALDE